MSDYFEKLKRGMGSNPKIIPSADKPAEEPKKIPEPPEIEEPKEEPIVPEKDLNEDQREDLDVIEPRDIIEPEKPKIEKKLKKSSPARAVKAPVKKIKRELTPPIAPPIEELKESQKAEDGRDKPVKKTKMPKKIENKIESKFDSSFPLLSDGKMGKLAIDIYQTDKEIIIQSAVGGVNPENLDVSIEKDLVSIKGLRENPLKEENKNYFRQECHWGGFCREIILPEETDSSKAEASIKNGILIVKIPKISKEEKSKIVVEKS